LTEARASRDAARQGEEELGDRCRTLQEDHERMQDSLENLRSLLLIVSTRPTVKNDTSLSSDLDKINVSITALCEANEDDPARLALEEFLADYSRLQDELDARDQKIANLTADAESWRQANSRLESNVDELREALEQVREGDPSRLQDDAVAAAHNLERAQLKDDIQRLKDECQDLNDNLKAAKKENGRLRKDLQRAVVDGAAKDEGDANSNEALRAKIEDLERIVRHQDAELEKLRKTHSDKDSERKKLEDDMEQLQMKNIALLETVASVDSGKVQAIKPPLDKHENGIDKDLQDDVARLKRELKDREKANEKEKKAVEKEIAELNANIEKLEKSKRRHKERAKDLEKDHTEKDKTIAELKDSVEKLEKANKALLNDFNKLKKEKERSKELERDVDDLENANKKLKDEVQKLKESGSNKEKDKNLDIQIKALEERIDELENENEALRRDNERLRNDLDQVALVFENRQLQPLSHAPSLNSSWSADGVPLSEYAAMIRQKLQELKHSSFDETYRLREDNDRLKDELDHFHKISQHLASKRDRERPAAASAERDEVTLVPTTVVHVHQAPNHQAPNDAEERLKRENIEYQAELVILKHKLQELDSKHKKAAESASDLERKNKALTSRLQQQGEGYSGINGDAGAREEMLEKRNRDLEAEVAALTKNLKQVSIS
jgi:chromosome segregation ATPase